MLKLFCAAVLAASWTLPSYAQASFGVRAFHNISVGESYDLLPFSCDPRGPSCEGNVDGSWVRVTVIEKHVHTLQIVYDGMKSDGSWFKVDHPSFVQALRENTYANTHKPFQIAGLFGANGEAIAWIDISNGILYEIQPNDPQKGIARVTYLEPESKLMMLAVQNDLTKHVALTALNELQQGASEAR